MTVTDTIKLPGLGPTPKSTALMLGGGVVLVIGVAWYRSKKTPAPPAPATPATDPNATGTDTGAAGTGAGVGGWGGSNWTPTTPTPGAYTTNAAWSQAAEDYLVNTVGSHADVVGNALGRYITGRALTSDQVQIIESAIAFVGYPPVNGPTGHPPAYLTVSDGGSGGGGGGGGSGTPAAPTGFHATHIGRDSARFQWNAVSGASHYTLYRDGHQVTDASGTTATATGLQPGHRYLFTVNAWNRDSSKRSAPAATHVATHH